MLSVGNGGDSWSFSTRQVIRDLEEIKEETATSTRN
jgi:hypothetical protein